MKNYISILFLFSLLITTNSCTDEREDFLPEESQIARVKIEIAPSSMTTRSTGLTTQEEKNVESIQLLIFDRNGKIVTKKYFSQVNVQTGLNNVITRSGTGMSIYAIANITSVNTNSTNVIDSIHTISDLNNLAVYTTGGDMETNRKLLMWGNAVNITIPPSPATITIPVILNYIASKIHVNLINNTPAGQQVSWTDWKLQNFPRRSYLIPRASDVVNPANSSDFLSSSSTFGWTDTTFVVGGVTKPGKSTVFYLFENRRGNRISNATPTSTKNKNLYAPGKATAIIANGFYQTSSQIKGIQATIYFGNNTYNNYDLVRAQEYTYNITVSGIDSIDVDSRIDGTNKGFQASVLNTTLDSHYDWRPLQLGAFDGTFSVAILNETGQPATSAFWLKVSNINLNQFINNGSGTYIRPTYNPATDMKTSISNISFNSSSQMAYQTYYLYADEFLTEGGTRTARVQVSNSQGGTVSIPITQKGIQSMGNTVGLRKLSLLGILSTENYRLMVENNEEATLSLTPGASPGTEKTNNMQWGFDGRDMQSVLLGVTLFDYFKRAGMDNTVNLVYSNTSTSTLYPPYGRTGNTTISEQVHNPIYNTYGARYCFEKNRDTNGDGKISGSEIKWYLPSIDELALMYAGEPSLSQLSTEKLSANPYLSSTENEGTLTDMMGLRLDNGQSGTASKQVALYARCVRAITSVTTVSPYSELYLLGGTLASSTVNNTGFKSTSLRSTQITRPVKIHLQSDSTNRTVSPRFIVAKADIIGITWAGASGWTTASNSANGTGVVASPATGCNNYGEALLNADVGTWRVPTQRELYLIYTVRKDLLGLNILGFNDFIVNANYWSSTASSATEAWAMDIGAGIMYNRAKNTNTFRVRCIKDI